MQYGDLFYICYKMYDMNTQWSWQLWTFCPELRNINIQRIKMQFNTEHLKQNFCTILFNLGARMLMKTFSATYFSGYILRATSIPGQQDKKAASAVSSKIPKMRTLFLLGGRIYTFYLTECPMILFLKSDLFIYIPHALLYNGINPGLTDDQVCHLHYNNTDKECSVACVLQNFSALICLQHRYNVNQKQLFCFLFNYLCNIYPLLAIVILQVIVIFTVPVDTQSYQRQWHESILSKDNKVCKEPCCCLHHSQ